MAIKISTKTTEVYVLISERSLPESEQTKFFISAPTYRDQMAIRDELYRGPVMEINGGRFFGRTVNLQAAKAFELLVSGINGLVDSDGKDVKVTSENRQQIMSMLPADVIWEVGNHIVESLSIADSEKN